MRLCFNTCYVCRLVVDTARAIQFAIDVAKGMAFIHSLDRQLPRLYLNSHHVMVSLTHPSLHTSIIDDLLFPD